ncbi:pre-tRNA nuclear export protein [Coccidioides posadasii str. Silveira]|uniref:Exportin-T n=2 Tax=Coccidioides posadasii TaxID=199306 RepID=E9DE02_COCPS|nr:HEAT repeat containing protein [Coccidioides posadasii C735 delta SOWgp]EER29429.1 HEAT repeat containing protein [Coccidioides posadasii C735 delta SOWgp]EFW15356.1 tRNA exportin [Coccidioides posadasii str. Silveira]QVM13480.1 pre-tRNA nuclear export protein [Coccidioides posadasii str. Silveira]|eukprot:XP_003071574.1 HEAT repeat containing protein [Coccidioides posadasii C735 delta SOWgp]
MEEQVANAIEIAGNPSSDQTIKAQAFDYLNQLRADPSGWQVCLSLFTKTPRRSDVVRHVALEIINSATQTGLVDIQGLSFIKDNLLTYLQQMYGPDGAAQSDPSNIQNKIAQTITYLFSALYATEWNTFFDDILRLTYNGPDSGVRDNTLGIIFYLRVINSIHDEIGDVLVSRSRAEQDRANILKDLIRERDVQKLVTSWQDILSQWQERNDLIAEMCLRAIGSWVSWINISLVVNQTMLDLLFRQLARVKDVDLHQGGEKVRDAAIDVFTEIVGKKMKPADKIDMIVYLNLESIVAQLTASPPLHEHRFTSKYDTDLAETVTKLVNITTVDIVKALDSEDADNATKEKAEALLQAFLPHILRYFSDEYDEICSTAIPCVNELLSYLRKVAKRNPAIIPQQSAMLLPILKAIIQKMRYDETSSWGTEDDQMDEMEFQDLRKRLNVLQQIIASTNEQLYMDAVSEVVRATFHNVRQSGGQIDWRDLDLALHEMFLFGELAVRCGGLYTKNKPNNPASERLIEMMLMMVESDIRSFRHPATQLQFMEICVRYSSFFEHHARFIPGVLEGFLQLAHHQMTKVKVRSWYLFHRLVKHLRNYIGNVAQTVIAALGDLLTINAEVPVEGPDGDDMSSEDHEGSADALFNNQLYLFEAIGTICSTSSVPLDKQVVYAQSIMNPIFIDMERNLGAAKSHDERALLQIHHDIMALGTLAKGFSDWIPGTSSPAVPPAPEISEAFGQVAEATLVALESLKFSFSIRTAARAAFSRLIGVRGSHNLPQLPRWIDGLLTQTSSKDEMALFLRLLDQVIFGFKTEIYGILDTLLTPFLQRVFAGISEPTTGTDDEIQLAELKREYLNFLLMILNNDLGTVIISTANQPIFETVITTIEHFAKDVDDFPTAKMAFLVLSRMSNLWGGPDVVQPSNPANGTTPSQSALPGFTQFMITRFSPLCWALPMNPSFNPKDAQAKQVLGEAAALQKIIYLKTGPEYVRWLRETELPGMGMGPDLVNEYVGSLEMLDIKGFRQFFQAFIQRFSA